MRMLKQLKICTATKRADADNFKVVKGLFHWLIGGVIHRDLEELVKLDLFT